MHSHHIIHLLHHNKKIMRLTHVRAVSQDRFIPTGNAPRAAVRPTERPSDES
jgi:hypothetical protein